ncbi:hypothetical protein [Legionella sp.]|uniref:hypothetical protein n=1 Tax=Legionella sp. TaxID=459 RepID=UPI003CC17697
MKNTMISLVIVSTTLGLASCTTTDSVYSTGYRTTPVYNANYYRAGWNNNGWYGNRAYNTNYYSGNRAYYNMNGYNYTRGGYRNGVNGYNYSRVGYQNGRGGYRVVNTMNHPVRYKPVVKRVYHGNGY